MGGNGIKNTTWIGCIGRLEEIDAWIYGIRSTII